MNNIIDDYKVLYNKIMNNNITLVQLEKEFEKIEASYGSDAFNPCDFQKKEKPWNKSYLEDLKKLYRAGASSKDFFIHLYEVTRYIRRKKLKYFIGLCLLFLLIILCIFIIPFLFKKWNKHEVQRISLESTSIDSCAIYNQVIDLPDNWTVVKIQYTLNDDKLYDGFHLYIQPRIIKCPVEKCKEKITVTNNNLQWKYFKILDKETFVHVLIPSINCPIHGEYKFEFPLGVEGEEYLKTYLSLSGHSLLEDTQNNTVEYDDNNIIEKRD